MILQRFDGADSKTERLAGPQSSTPQFSLTLAWTVSTKTFMELVS